MIVGLGLQLNMTGKRLYAGVFDRESRFAEAKCNLDGRAVAVLFGEADSLS
jgi:hypothetical protein